jgi:hypothetical protein
MEEEKIVEKMRAGLTREQAIQALERQAEHDDREKKPTNQNTRHRARRQPTNKEEQ